MENRIYFNFVNHLYPVKVFHGLEAWTFSPEPFMAFDLSECEEYQKNKNVKK
jgi:hypothetical protein